MNFPIEITHTEKVWAFEFPSKIGFSIFVFFILGFGIIVQKKLITFLRYMKKRPINQIIYKNLILQNILYPPLLLYSLLEIWDYNPGSDVVGYQKSGLGLVRVLVSIYGSLSVWVISLRFSGNQVFRILLKLCLKFI